MPEYCKYYPTFSDGEKLNSLVSNSNSKKTLYQTCRDGSLTSYSVDDLVKIVDKVELKTLDDMGKTFQKKLAAEGVKQVLKKRAEYFGLFSNVDAKLSKDLLTCGREHSHYKKDDRSYIKIIQGQKEYNPDMGIAISNNIPKSSPQINLKKQKDFMILNIVNAIKAKALFNINKDHYKNLDQAVREGTWARNKCRQEQKKCGDAARFYESKYHCSESYDECLVKNRDKPKEKKNEFLKNKIAPLYGMVSTSPLLFNNTDQGNVLNFMNSNELAPSSVMERIINNVPSEKVKELQTYFETNNLKQINSFFKNNIELISNIVDDKNKYASLVKESEEEMNKEFQRLDEAALELCEGEGRNLHHYPDLVNNVMKDSFKNSTKYSPLKTRVAAEQATYCHLLNSQPLEANELSVAAISGFALLGVGAVLQLVPIIGTVTGGALITVGTGVATAGLYTITAGSVVLTGMGYKDAKNSHDLLQSDIALHSVGLHGYQKLLETQDNRDSNIGWAVGDTFLGAVDLGALVAYHRAQKVSKLKLIDETPKHGNGKRTNVALRKQIDKIKKDYPDTLINKMLAKYNVGNKFDLPEKGLDQFYIGALAMDLEKKWISNLKKRNKIKGDYTLSHKQKRSMKKSVDEELEKIATKCNKTD